MAQKFMKTYVNESCAQLFSELAGTVPAGCQLSWHRPFVHISFHTFLWESYLYCKTLHIEKKHFHNVFFSAFYSHLKFLVLLCSRKICNFLPGSASYPEKKLSPLLSSPKTISSLTRCQLCRALIGNNSKANREH